MPFKVGVSTGLYYISRAEDLAGTLKKIGYALTAGTSTIEISGEVPHEITFTEGRDAIILANKQGLELAFHGSLTIPMCIPEMTYWRDAHDHLIKSVRSAVLSGGVYVNVHSCLREWLELITYAGSKLEVTMCDHAGRFISEVLFVNKRLRKWFAKNMWKIGEGRYPQCILSDAEYRDAQYRAHSELRIKQQRENEAVRKKIIEEFIKSKKLSPDEANAVRTGRILPRKIERKIVEAQEMRAGQSGTEEALRTRKYIEDAVRKKLARDDFKDRDWTIKTHARLSDAYKIMGNYLFFTNDPIWTAMVEMYRDTLSKYNINYSDDNWLDNALEKAENTNDRDFKEFYYAVIGAKYLEGHMRALLKWINDDFIKKELKDKPQLQEYARKLHIVIETPDARDPSHAGLFILWHPKQVYAAIKTIRKQLHTKRVWMNIDFEHVATQGVDVVNTLRDLKKMAPDFGRYIKVIHANAPNPLHAHYPIELGDTTIYKLLYICREAGMGKKELVYLIFERGGGKDPFQHAVDALKLMAIYLEKNVPTEKLPLKFYGLKETAGDIIRQGQIIRAHRFEPLKDLFEIPEEDWGTLSSAAMKKGKREQFKKEELR